MKRFRIVTSGMFAGEVKGKFDTTQQCYDCLSGLPEDDYIIEDLEEDTFVVAGDFIQAFIDGECPGDLSFF